MSFEVRYPSGNLPVASGLMVTAVERDDGGIHVDYDYVMAPLHNAAAVFTVGQPRGEGMDDLGNVYQGLGGHFGLAAGDGARGSRIRACGRFMLPIPLSEAVELRIRITPHTRLPSIWATPMREFRVSLVP
jgi:hypothetical protein